MKFDEKTLEKRKPLWLALSDLFLDTELDDRSLWHIARKMKESGYGLSEITDILINEVFPVCIPNMHCVAGEWAGFDERQLYERITELKPPNLVQRLFHKASFWMIREDWEAVIQKFRSEPPLADGRGEPRR